MSTQFLDGTSLGFAAMVINSISRLLRQDRADEFLHRPNEVKLLLTPLLDDEYIDLLPALSSIRRRESREQNGKLMWLEYLDVMCGKSRFNLKRLLEKASAKGACFLSEDRAQQIRWLLQSSPMGYHVPCILPFVKDGAVVALKCESDGTSFFKIDPAKDQPCAPWTVFFFNEAKTDGSNRIDPGQWIR